MTKQFKVAGIGELLWDILPQGKQLGGAPCNFAYHVYQAECQPFVISSLGPDASGDEILTRFDELELDKSFVQLTQGFSTGTVTISLDVNGIPSYIIQENVAWDNMIWNNSLEALAKSVDAVCFGSLAQRNSVSRQTILKFLETTRPDCLKVLDINLRQSFYNRVTIIRSLEFANILKLNDDELLVVAGLLGLQGTDDELMSQLMQKFSLKLVAVTKGDKGSILMTSKEKSFMEVPKVKIADTVGAGDSFTAILVAGLLRNEELKRIHKTATQIAAFVCTQKGATPKLPKSLLKF
ncbi:carbohydrate kinase family protein [Microbacter margulisiae]|uniref:Fructokinase n=1 Tax=Microbacter margulisiae TaxID=1350067 RepID=A0A7W5DP55_9PORP|nr:carbohydrate kinase [Microbacter margulisiae]MBB3186210.1 fructokinase [Microbacter margulisiae]